MLPLLVTKTNKQHMEHVASHTRHTSPGCRRVHRQRANSRRADSLRAPLPPPLYSPLPSTYNRLCSPTLGYYCFTFPSFPRSPGSRTGTS